jgi:histidine ammonia-lyase
MNNYYIENKYICILDFEKILNSNVFILLSEESKKSIIKCREYLDEKLEKSSDLIYGINTGFGFLCNTEISKKNLSQLQVNLVLSHSCGMGEEIPTEIVRRMMLLKALALAKGKSGVQLKTVERLLFFFNKKITPIIYEKGSLGASGDLVPLAHLTLPLIGEGEVQFEGQRYTGAEICKKFTLEPLKLLAKEGLALLNGTEFMLAYATYCLAKSNQLWKNWNLIASMSLDAFDGKINPFQDNVNLIRNQMGQIEVAKLVKQYLEGSEIINQVKKHVQDPYSFRCIPQVHGAVKDTLDHCSLIIEREINGVTDNPTIFYEEDDIVSAGNFHGEPLALILDFMAIAMAEMGNISERRVFKLISGSRGLPTFLIKHPGLNSGLMITQYTSASMVSQNKQLCTPASVDSIDSSNGQEDHVSMGANAATKLARIIENCFAIQAIELLNATQSLDFCRPLKSSPPIEILYRTFRKKISFIEQDRNISLDLKLAIIFVKELQ